MLKRILYSLLVILIVILIGMAYGIKYFNNLWFEERPNHLKIEIEDEHVHFNWGQKKYGDYVEEHDAILIPVKIKDLPHRFYVQFDTGTPNTVLAGNTLKNLMQLQPDLSISEKSEMQYLNHLEFTLGGSVISADSIQIMENYGQSFELTDTTSRIKLGSIGADFLVDRISIIDFENQTIQFLDQKPSWIKSLSFHPFSFEGRRLMLPTTIGDKKLKLFYDSGSSAFGLITSKNRYDASSNPDEKEIRYSANSWGNSLVVIHKETDEEIEIGGENLPLKRISYVDIYANFQRFMIPFTRIGGWLGNKPFTNSVLIIDTRNEEFTVTKSLNSTAFDLK